MSDDTLKEIRAHHARADNPGSTWTDLRVSQELETAHADRATLLTLLESAHKQVEAYREALEPFGKIMTYPGIREEASDMKSINELGDYITIGDLRRAASVLATTSMEDKT